MIFGEVPTQYRSPLSPNIWPTTSASQDNNGRSEVFAENHSLPCGKHMGGGKSSDHPLMDTLL
jgi:hypothetical protein